MSYAEGPDRHVTDADRDGRYTAGQGASCVLAGRAFLSRAFLDTTRPDTDPNLWIS